MKFEDRFSNIDDKTAERLSQKYPFLDEERKARLYTMSSQIEIMCPRPIISRYQALISTADLCGTGA